MVKLFDRWRLTRTATRMPSLQHSSWCCHLMCLSPSTFFADLAERVGPNRVHSSIKTTQLLSLSTGWHVGPWICDKYRRHYSSWLVCVIKQRTVYVSIFVRSSGGIRVPIIGLTPRSNEDVTFITKWVSAIKPRSCILCRLQLESASQE